MTPRVLAHRGFHWVERENSLGAFEAAAAAGFDGVELDLRRLGDGTVVLHHDRTLPDGRLLAQLDRHEWRGDRWADLAGWADAHPDLFLDVEVKEPGLGPALAPALDRRGPHTFAVTSFDLREARSIAVAHPSWGVGWIVGRGGAGAVRRAARAGLRLLVLPRRLATPPRIASARRAGLGLFVWDLPPGDAATVMADPSVEAVIVDEPEPWIRLSRPRAGTTRGPRSA